MTSWSNAWRKTKWGSRDPPAGTRILRSTTSRRASRTTAAGSSATAVSNSSSIRVPAAAATRSTSWPASETAARRARTTSRSLGGSASVVRLPRRGKHLFGEEGVAAGALPDPIDELRVGSRAELVGEEQRELVAVKPPEIDAIDALATLELGEVCQHLVVGVELVGADGRDQQDPLVAQVADEEGEQVPGRGIGPVEVLDDDRHRCLPGETIDDPEHELEQADLGEPVVGAAIGR